jgi:hypothetical protein
MSAVPIMSRYAPCLACSHPANPETRCPVSAGAHTLAQPLLCAPYGVKR